MLLVYVNDMPKDKNNYMNVFADDAKILRRKRREKDCRELQKDLERLYEWGRYGMWNLVLRSVMY